MNVIKRKYLLALRQLYVKKLRRNKLRKILKYSLSDDRIQVEYKNINLMVGLNSSIEHAVFFDEYNEKFILELISYFASENYDFLDVGANIGIHSLTAAKSNNKIEVFSFEPEPLNFKTFIKNIGLNNVDNIKPFCLGVGDFNGVSKMNINPGCNKGTHSLKVKFEKQIKSVDIPVVKLDKFKDIIISDQIMLKIDVEGFEKEVLQGALDLLSSKKNSMIIIELLDETNGMVICQEIVDILRRNDFASIFKIKNSEAFEAVNNYQGSGDYVFLKGSQTTNFFNSFNK